MLLYEKLITIEQSVMDLVKQPDYGDIDNALKRLTIVQGRKARGKNLKPPLLAVYFGNINIDHNDMSHYEKWNVPIFIIGLVVDKDPQLGRIATTKLVCTAREHILIDRGLKNTVSDIKGQSFTPADERNDETLFGAGAELVARFTHKVKI